MNIEYWRTRRLKKIRWKLRRMGMAIILVGGFRLRGSPGCIAKNQRESKNQREERKMWSSGRTHISTDP